jgi:hypothetical protein
VGSLGLQARGLADSGSVIDNGKDAPPAAAAAAADSAAWMLLFISSAFWVLRSFFRFSRTARAGRHQTTVNMRCRRHRYGDNYHINAVVMFELHASTYLPVLSLQNAAELGCGGVRHFIETKTMGGGPPAPAPAPQ